MAELVSLLTPTNINEPAFKLLEKYILRQTWKGPIHWVVIDDSPSENVVSPFNLYSQDPFGNTTVERMDTRNIGTNTKEEYPSTTPRIVKLSSNVTQYIYKSPQAWQPGFNTQRICLSFGITRVPKETTYLFFCEYDDHFTADFVETMVYFLRKFPMVGQANSRYYSVKDRSYKHWRNFDHCSLTETAIKAELIPLAARAFSSGVLFMDLQLWNIAKSEKVKTFVFDHIGIAHGMKQVSTQRQTPGDGIGSGHRPERDFLADPLFEKLREWLGAEDAQAYMTWGRK